MLSLIFEWECMLCISISYIAFFEWFRRSNIHWKPAERIGSIFYFSYSIVNTIALLWISYKYWNDENLSDLNILSLNALSTTYLNPSKWILTFKIYYLSKMYEYSDLILVYLTNKITIGNHFRLHHYTTLSLAFTFIFDKNESNGIPFHCLIFMTNNVLMHLMIYLYHSNMIHCVKNSNTFYYLTRFQGYNQLLSGIFFCSLSMFAYDQFNIIYLWTLFCYSLYFSLFQWELYHSWKDKRVKQS